MTRKITLLAAALMLLFTFIGTSGADAQSSEQPYNEALVYPDGGFGNAGGDNATPSPTSSVVTPATTPATGTTGGGNAIAFTGSESAVLGYVGAGLIGFGAVALVAARRKENADLD